ncbi:Ubiquitin carboxyl-terminal hydrolase 32 [Lamellibrachia satsuma]|nr:Ubiquitin carboxyl-terminal hydrolase 32 [Lamellibrachia satsuma]
MLKQVYDFLATRLRIHKDDMRLWKFKDEQNMSLLEDESQTMEVVGVEENSQILIEVRNKDLTWPEEMCQLAKNKASMIRSKQTVSALGATGLNNLGNTCFMNSALQCVSNTRVLTLYFTAGMHLYEVNRENPLGMKGHVAQRYGDLVKDLWSGTMKSIAPLKLRWTIGKYAPRFNGFQQHDSQELLAFLLDGLHEDLNRVHDKPYVELKDSDGRSDQIVAKEAWDNHLLRNRSIIVDLFHGQLKSCVRCKKCGHTSVRFDPFTYLSLPLPMESCIHLEIIVVRLDGSTPTKYGLRLNMDEKYKGLKSHLGELCDIPATQLLLAEVFGALVKSFPHNDQKIRTVLTGTMYAYELGPPSVIPPLTIEEERAMTLPQIQRLQHSKNSSPQKHSTPAKKMVVANGDVTHIQSQPSSVPTANGIGCRGNPTQGNSNVLTQLDNMNNSSSSTAPSLANSNMAAYTIAVHRKMFHMDVYFLSSQKSRPSLFGTPLVLPIDDHTTNQDLYRAVWVQVSRLVSPLPPAENNTHNHAQDCDDSLGYEYPFTLKVVKKDGFTCAHCPWYRKEGLSKNQCAREREHQLWPLPSAFREEGLSKNQCARERENPSSAPPPAFRKEGLSKNQCAREREHQLWPLPSAFREEGLSKNQKEGLSKNQCAREREHQLWPPPSAFREEGLSKNQCAREREHQLWPLPSAFREEGLSKNQCAREREHQLWPPPSDFRKEGLSKNQCAREREHQLWPLPSAFREEGLSKNQEEGLSKNQCAREREHQLWPPPSAFREEGLSKNQCAREREHQLWPLPSAFRKVGLSKKQWARERNHQLWPPPSAIREEGLSKNQCAREREHQLWPLPSAFREEGLSKKQWARERNHQLWPPPSAIREEGLSKNQCAREREHQLWPLPSAFREEGLSKNQWARERNHQLWPPPSAFRKEGLSKNQWARERNHQLWPLPSAIREEGLSKNQWARERNHQLWPPPSAIREEGLSKNQWARERNNQLWPPPSAIREEGGRKNQWAREREHQLWPPPSAIRKEGGRKNQFCRGCRLDFSLEAFTGSSNIAVDWEPTALHLRYQTAQEKQYVEHASVVESRRLQTEPIDLDACLKAFMKEEELGEDELYYCSKCKQHQLAVKKLDIWTLPPVLIIHLKRFQFLNGHWVKSQKIVKFPFSDFTPCDYVVPRDKSKKTVKTTPDITQAGEDINSNGFNTTSKNVSSGSGHRRCGDKMTNGHETSCATQVSSAAATSESACSKPITTQPTKTSGDGEVKRADTNKTSDVGSCVKDATSASAEVSDAEYDLYAMSCHTGILGGGHYVSYAKNPNNKWYCYNDSSCKEMLQGQIDTSSAYILFYERRDLNSGGFMPDITGHEPDTTEITDEFESEFKKMCTLQ